MSKYDQPPRKVVVGSVIRGFFQDPPGLDHRIAVASEYIDRLAAEAKRKYDGRGLDLVALPENAVSTGKKGPATVRAVDLDGAVLDAFAAKARQHNTYIVLPIVLAADREADVYYNAAVLLDRRGAVVGTYRKVHIVAHVMTDVLEGGMTAGSEFPVFETDFGRIGIQICYDMVYDDGWDALARKGAELIVWPTASPAKAQPAARAGRGRFFIVASAYRDNTTIYEPTGLVAARVNEPDDILVHEIDLNSMVLPWSEHLRNGDALTERFGDSVGYHYDPTEDIGLFWSNDPATPIGRMADEIRVRQADAEIERNRKLQDELRGGPPEA